MWTLPDEKQKAGFTFVKIAFKFDCFNLIKRVPLKKLLTIDIFKLLTTSQKHYQSAGAVFIILYEISVVLSMNPKQLRKKHAERGWSSSSWDHKKKSIFVLTFLNQHMPFWKHNESRPLGLTKLYGTLYRRWNLSVAFLFEFVELHRNFPQNSW